MAASDDFYAASKLSQAAGWYFWRNWDEQLSGASMLGGSNTPEVNDVNQGKLGTCYFMAALASVATKQNLLQKSLLTTVKNEAGIYGFKFYIRGKPWVVSIDSTLLFENPEMPSLVYSQLEKRKAIWPVLYEKAYAKIKGNYDLAVGGFYEDAIRSLTGAPVFTSFTS